MAHCCLFHFFGRCDRAVSSSVLTTCSSKEVRCHCSTAKLSIISSVSMLPKFATTELTGTLVPLKTKAPLTTPGTCSTASQPSQKMSEAVLMSIWVSSGMLESCGKTEAGGLAGYGWGIVTTVSVPLLAIALSISGMHGLIFSQLFSSATMILIPLGILP